MIIIDEHVSMIIIDEHDGWAISIIDPGNHFWMLIQYIMQLGSCSETHQQCQMEWCYMTQQQCQMEWCYMTHQQCQMEWCHMTQQQCQMEWCYMTHQQCQMEWCYKTQQQCRIEWCYMTQQQCQWSDVTRLNSSVRWRDRISVFIKSCETDNNYIWKRSESVKIFVLWMVYLLAGGSFIPRDPPLSNKFSSASSDGRAFRFLSADAINFKHTSNLYNVMCQHVQLFKKQHIVIIQQLRQFE